MKGLFPQYAGPPFGRFADIWKHALFVFDTNVLLNLYRYREETREELLAVIDKLRDRIWIPHHVALEFQRNRLGVIADQMKRFADVRNTVTESRTSLFAGIEKVELNKRHSTINPEALVKGFNELINTFLADLDKLQEFQLTVTSPDPIRDKLEKLFDGRVGEPPKDQDEVDRLYKEAQLRYDAKIPPGFEDADKGKDGADEYIFGRIAYKRRFGDYLVWQQFLTYAKGGHAKTVIFVTGEQKKDWWRKINADGPKTSGPQIEMIEETRVASVETFLMYDSAGFLKYAKEYLKADVSDDTLTDVREVSTARETLSEDQRRAVANAHLNDEAVRNWLARQFGSVSSIATRYPKHVALQNGKRYGFEVIPVSIRAIAINPLRDVIKRASIAINESDFEQITLIYVFKNVTLRHILMERLVKLADEGVATKVRIVIGVRDDTSTEGTSVNPVAEFKFD